MTTVGLGRSVGPPVLSKDLILYPATDGRGHDWNVVEAVDLRTRVRMMLASTGFRHGMINWVARTGDWTVYVDQSSVQSDAVPEVLWRIRATQDGGRRSVLLATSGSTRSSYIPTVVADGPRVLWLSLPPTGAAHLTQWQPGWRSPRRVQGGPVVDPAAASISRGHVIFQDRSDCWSASLGQKSFVRRTRSTRALDCFGNAKWLVWRERADASDSTDPDRTNDPFEIWAHRLGGSPFLVARGYMPATYPYVAGDVVLYMNSSSRYVLEDLVNRRPLHRFPLYLDRYDPFGDDTHLVFVTESEADSVDTAHVIALGVH